MLFGTSYDSKEAETFLRQTIGITGIGFWRKRHDEFRILIQGNPLMASYIDEKFSIERGMERALQYKRNTGKFPNMMNTSDNSILKLYSFTLMIAQVYQNLSAAGKKRLSGMLRDSLQSDHGVAPLAFEMGVAADLMRRGFDVRFNDMEGSGFDYIATRRGIQFEVECKTISGDLGRQIHRRRLFQFGGLISRAMSECLASGAPQGHFARVVLPGELHGRQEYMQELAALVERVLRSRADFEQADIGKSDYASFPISGSPFDLDRHGALDQVKFNEFLKSKNIMANGNSLLKFRPKHSAVVVVLISAKPDKVVPGLLRQIKAGATQFSENVPAALCVELTNVGEDQLLRLMDAPSDLNKPTAFQVATGEFFKSSKRQHVHTLAFYAPGHFKTSTRTTGSQKETHLQEGGRFLSYTNKRNQFAPNQEYKLFGND